MRTGKSLLFLLLVLLTSGDAPSQATFKAGFKTFVVGSVIHEYTYTFNAADSARLTPVDSAKTLIAADSAATMLETYNQRDKANYKTIHYYNSKRQLVKKEDYKNDNLQEVNDWTYDDKNRKATHYRENKVTNTRYLKNYSYSLDKKTGEMVATESSFVNNKIEFYTKLYYDKHNVLQKEVRLNDNNKDVIHVESFTYGENGKVKERSVFFPEFRVTKKHQELAGELPKKCFSMLPAGTLEKVALAKRVLYTKRVLVKNAAIMADAECKDYEYTFTNNVDCTITVTPAAKAGLKTVKFRLREKF
ncbi:MAG: hypothetical protein KF744_07325 [Taibaiella sp.]|nr:hypothetical protein [Taibaiella sp.]